MERRKRMFVGICCEKGPPPLITSHERRTFINTPPKYSEGGKKSQGFSEKRDGELISSPTPPSCENPFISGEQKTMMSPRFSLVFHHITQQGGDGWEEGCCFFHTTIRSYTYQHTLSHPSPDTTTTRRYFRLSPSHPSYRLLYYERGNGGEVTRYSSLAYIQRLSFSLSLAFPFSILFFFPILAW